MEKQSYEKRFALLIDADNVSAKYIKPITDELSNYGTVTYKRIYGDWTLTLHSKWKEALLENSITPIQQFGYTQGKNATDSAMIIDAMDILFTKSVEGFCIVSSDSDFTRLASRIRESGLMVIGMGEKKTPTPFRKACDIFTTLELLLGDSNGKNNRGKARPDQGTNGPAATAGPSIEEIEQAVANIITDNQNNGKSTGLGEVGSRLLKRYPDFDVRSYGTNLLSKLLDEFSSVQITKDGSSVSVELTSDAERESKRKSHQSKEAAATSSSTLPAAPAALVQEGTEQAATADQPEQEDASDHAEQVVAPRPHRKPRRSKNGATQRVREVKEETSSEVASEVPAAAPEEATREDNRPGRATRKKTLKQSDSTPQQEETPETLIRHIVSNAGPEGIALATLGKRVRAKFRAFKLRDLGYSQFKTYLADLEGVEIEQRDGQSFAHPKK